MENEPNEKIHCAACTGHLLQIPVVKLSVYYLHMTLETHLNQKDSVTIKGLEKLIQKKVLLLKFQSGKPTVKRIFPKPEYKPTKLPKLVPLLEFSVEVSPTHHNLPPHRWSCCVHVPGVRGRTWPSNPGFFPSVKARLVRHHGCSATGMRV